MKDDLRLANTEDHLRSGHVAFALSYWLTTEEQQKSLKEVESIALERMNRAARKRDKKRQSGEQQ